MSTDYSYSYDVLYGPSDNSPGNHAEIEVGHAIYVSGCGIQELNGIYAGSHTGQQFMFTSPGGECFKISVRTFQGGRPKWMLTSETQLFYFAVFDPSGSVPPAVGWLPVKGIKGPPPVVRPFHSRFSRLYF